MKFHIYIRMYDDFFLNPACISRDLRQNFVQRMFQASITELHTTVTLFTIFDTIIQLCIH